MSWRGGRSALPSAMDAAAVRFVLQDARLHSVELV